MLRWLGCLLDLAQQDTNYAFFSQRDVEHNNGK